MGDEIQLAPFEYLPFPEQVRIAVLRLQPLPRELQGRDVLLGYLTTPLTADKVRAAWGGGDFRLAYTPSGHKIPTITYELTIDGEPEPLELEAYLPSARKQREKKRAEEPEREETPRWARILMRRMSRLESNAEPPQSRATELRELILLSRELSGGGKDSRIEYRDGYKQGLEDARELQGAAEPKSLGDAVAEAIPVIADVMRTRAIAARPALPAPAPVRPQPVVRPQPAAARAVQAPARAEAAPEPPPRAPDEDLSWMANVAREIARGQKAPEDMVFTAAFVLRYVPDALVEQLKTAMPSATIDQVMRLDPLVQKFGGQPLERGYVNGLVTQMLAELHEDAEVEEAEEEDDGTDDGLEEMNEDEPQARAG